MEPKQDIPEPAGSNPPPQIIKPGSSLADNGMPEAVSPQSTQPKPATVGNPIINPPEPQASPTPAAPNPVQPEAKPPELLSGTPAQASHAATAFQPDLPTQTPPVSPPTDQMPVDPNKLFQADSGLPSVNTNQGNFSVDNRPPGRFKRIFKNKKITALLAGQLVAILLVVGGVFGYYLPNRPGAVWDTGLNRSGQALDKLLTQATDQKQLEAFKKSEVNVSLSVKAPTGNFQGDFTGRFDQSKADGSLNFSVNEGGNNTKLAMKYISILAAGAAYPDFYAQFNGIKALGADALVPGISQYDGKWISVDSNYFASLGLPVPSPNTEKNNINSGDVSELIRAVSSVSKDYILTSDKDRAVIKQIKFVGKEKTDGISAYHYIAGIDKDHAKDYCKALYEKVATTKIYKNFSGNNQNAVDSSKKADIEACQRDNTNINTNFDLWIDAKYKLIHKIRIPDESNNQAYTDIGQTYKGGDDISLFVNYHDGKQSIDVNVTFSTNIKSIDSKGEVSITGGRGSETYSGKATLEIKPLSGDLNIQKPADSIPLQKILKKYGYDPTSDLFNDSLSGQQGQARDSEEKSDINAIYSEAEIYFAQNAYYPTLSELNSSSWRSANLHGLTADSLTPAGSSAAGLASKASTKQYGYSTSGCSAKGCTGFVLTALLSNGQIYKKTGSNN